MRKLLNRLLGQLHLRIQCAFPERVLNLCAARGLALRDLNWESAQVFTCRISRQDWRQLRKALPRLDAEATLLGREGLPYFLIRFRHRQALVIGLTALCMFLVLGSFFVWDFSIEGNKTVSSEEILRALEQNGVGLGSFGLTIDSEDVRNHVLLEIPELSWIAVNVSGCRATVQVRERDPVPELLREQEPTNLVARLDGVVLKILPLGGVRCVLPDSSVQKGQLLLSGVADTGTYGAVMLAGRGSVTARTWHRLSLKLPLVGRQKQYTGKTRTLPALVFGKHRVKFFGNSGISQGNYDKITKRTPLSLLGIPLPVTVVAETLRFYEIAEVPLDEAALQRQAEAILSRQLHRQVDPYGSVESALCTANRRSDGLTVTLTAECVEEIGVRVPIYTDNG